MREFPKDDTLSPNGRATEFKPEYSNLHPIQNAYGPMGGEMPGPSMQTYNEYGQPIPSGPELVDFLHSLEFAHFENSNHHLPMHRENLVGWPEQDATYLDGVVLEERAVDIRGKLRLTAMTMNQPHHPTQEVIRAIEFITANKIAYWIKLFFRHWHKHAPMIHEHTFEPCSAALPVVLSVMCLGGMVSFRFPAVELFAPYLADKSPSTPLRQKMLTCCI